MIYVGLDPGQNGAIVRLSNALVARYKMPNTETDLWSMFCDIRKSGAAHTMKAAIPIVACIEQQTPRPTFFGGRSSILKSTCVLYGNYMQLRGMLIAAGISFEEVPPKRWQQALKIPPRLKTETDTQWKNRLKGRAQQLYPQVNVTLAIADALLIATYCKRKHEGSL